MKAVFEVLGRERRDGSLMPSLRESSLSGTDGVSSPQLPPSLRLIDEALLKGSRVHSPTLRSRSVLGDRDGSVGVALVALRLRRARWFLHRMRYLAPSRSHEADSMG